MAVVVIDTIKPKNQGTFPVVEAADVKVSNDKRLDTALNEKANASTVEALSTAVAGKASQSDLTTLSNTVADKADKSALAETNTAVAGKQAALTEAQLTACNSGITSELVTQIGTNTTAIEGKASAADVTALASEVDDKADSSDVTVAVNDLQGQINQIVISASAESVVAPEVAAARTSAFGVEFSTLKDRIDSTDNKVAVALTVGNFTEQGWINAATGSFSPQSGSSTNVQNYATPYIPVNNLLAIKYKTYVSVATTAQDVTIKTAALAFYNSSKQFISSITLNETGVAEGIATPPAGTAYVRAANWYNTSITEPLCLLYVSSDLILGVTGGLATEISALDAARTNANGAEYQTLKSRLDNSDTKIATAMTVGDFSIQGWINAANGNFSPQSGTSSGVQNFATDYIEIDELSIIKYKSYVAVTGDTKTAAIAFYDSEKTFISAITADETGVVQGIAVVPSGSKYLRAANWNNSELIEPVCWIYTTTKKITNLISSSTEYQKFYGDFTITGYFNGNGIFSPSDYGKVTDFTPIFNNSDKLYYKLYSNDTSTDEVRLKIGLVVFYDASQTIISTFYNTGVTGFAEGELSIPQNAVYYRATNWTTTGSESCYIYEKVSVPVFMSDTTDKLNEIDAEIRAIQSNEKNYWNTDSLNKPFDFINKGIVAFGDSITNGVASPNLQHTDPYIKLFANHVSATLDNKSYSGSSITDITSANSIYSKIMAYSDDTDFIVVSGGTNDWNTSKEIGSFADVLDTSDSDTVTLYACMKAICAHLAQKTATIIFITPIPYTQAYIDAHSDVNSLGYTLSDYRKAIFEVATSYGFNVVDGASLGMPTGKGGWNNAMCDDTDGCHPTVAGHQLYARSLAGKLL